MRLKQFIKSNLVLLIAILILIISLFFNYKLLITNHYLGKMNEITQEHIALNACVNTYYAKKDQQFLLDCTKNLKNIKDLSLDRKEGSPYVFLNYSYYSPYDLGANPFDSKSGFIGESEWHKSFIPLYGIANADFE